MEANNGDELSVLQCYEQKSSFWSECIFFVVHDFSHDPMTDDFGIEKLFSMGGFGNIPFVVRFVYHVCPSTTHWDSFTPHLREISKIDFEARHEPVPIPRGEKSIKTSTRCSRVRKTFYLLLFLKLFFDSRTYHAGKHQNRRQNLFQVRIYLLFHPLRTIFLFLPSNRSNW